MTLGHTPTQETLRLVDGCPLDLELEFVDTVTGDPIDVSGRQWELPLAAAAGGSALASFTVVDGDEPNTLRASITAEAVTELAGKQLSGRWWFKDVTNGLVTMDGRFAVKRSGNAGIAMPSGPSGVLEVRLTNRTTIRAVVVAARGADTLTPEQEAALEAAGDRLVAMTPAWYVNAASTAVEPRTAAYLAGRAVRGDVEAKALAGLAEVPDLSGNGRHAVNAGVAAPIAPGSWAGQRVLGNWTRPAPVAWVTEHFQFRATKARMLPNWSTADTGGWNEIMLATIDENSDYFEPAFVQYADGVHLGLDIFVEENDGEMTWLSEGLLPDPFGDHDYLYDIDGTAGTVTVYIDGQHWETSPFDPEASPTAVEAPFTFRAPPAGHPVMAGHKSILFESVTIYDAPGGSVVLSGTAADGMAGWTPDAGIVSGPFPTARFIHGASGTSGWEAEQPTIPADRDWTWAVRGRFWPGTTVWWHSGFIEHLFGGAPGWGLSSSADFGGTAFGFVLGDGTTSVRVDAGAPPDGDALVVVELDRTAGEARMYVDGVMMAEVLVEDLGAITTGQPNSFAAGYGDTEWHAQFDRLLTADEMAALEDIGTPGRLASIQGRQGPHVDLSDVFATRAQLDALAVRVDQLAGA